MLNTTNEEAKWLGTLVLGVPILLN